VIGYQPPTEAVLRVGDPRRTRIGTAVISMLLTATVFVAFAFSAKQVRVLYLHSPWEEDPYDAVVSFTIFFVPLVPTSACCACH
jgi:hypothetical protein